MNPLLFLVPRIKSRPVVRPEAGARPGTLMVTGEAEPTRMIRHVYGRESYTVEPVDPARLEQSVQLRPGEVVWLEVCGLKDTDTLRRLGALLELHPLLIEDIVHTHQRPKLEQVPGGLMLFLRALNPRTDNTIENEQVSLLLRPGLLVTFCEFSGELFEPIKKRLREAVGKIREAGADYLMYAVVDLIIDKLFPVIEIYADTIDDIEEQVHQRQDPVVPVALQNLRRELRRLRRAVLPLRDSVSTLSRGQIAPVSGEVAFAFRDCHDHLIQVAEFADNNLERATETVNLYLTLLSEKTNQVMKVLTIIATIFIPLTFICGVYGMNFDTAASPYNMPELRWAYGYPAFWAVSVGITLLMLWWFRRRGWLGGQK